MPKKRKDEEEEVYHVEVIAKARVSEDSDWEYLVKWAGYDSDADSWEPSANVQQCERLLGSFWKHVGMDNRDYPVGYEVTAGEDWINKEKRYFAETFVKSPKQHSDEKDRQERRKSKSSTPPTSDSSASDLGSSDKLSSVRKISTKKPSRRVRISDTESESGSDQHHRKEVKITSHSKATALPSKEIPKVKRQELSSTIGSSSSIAPPRVPAVRTHQDQRINPLVKPMNLSSRSVDAGSSLSTKQRVAAGIPPPPTGPKPLPPVPKKSLPPLSFKKNKSLVLPTSQTKDTIESGTSVAKSPSRIDSLVAINDGDMVASPQPMDIDQPVDFFSSILNSAGPPDASSSESLTGTIPLKSQKEIDTEKFLQTVHIPELSRSLEMATISDQSEQPITELNKALAIPKYARLVIPKKWRWCGDLFISTSESKTELLCAVTIADPSGISNSSHINLLLSPLDSLQISRLYPIMDVSPLLQACGKPQYFGGLESNEPSEEVVIHGLELHLTSEGLAAAIPLLLDGIEVAVLIVFPGAQQGLTKVLQVPEHLLSGTPLLVVLLPFLVSTMTSTNVAGWRSIKTVVQSSSNLQDTLVPHELPQEAVLYQAMSLLHFPKALLDFLNSSPTRRAYCIWPPPNQLSPGLDTAMLQCILKSIKATSAKPEEDVRVFFLSNRYLDKLHAMPSLVTKCANSPEVQFWTYGYSAGLTCESWRVQEVYPLGGVVTFTASALAEDLVGCHQLISQITDHPLWECYLIPEVLAVSHLLCSNMDLSSPSDSCLGSILDLITLGTISAIKMPERGHSNQMAWLSQAFNHSSATGQELLATCLEALRSCPTTLDMTAEQLITFTNDEVSKDLSNARIQPTFMKNYRRFVVIRAASEESIPSDKNGLEWSSLSLFSFKDDYFTQP